MNKVTSCAVLAFAALASSAIAQQPIFDWNPGAYETMRDGMPMRGSLNTPHHSAMPAAQIDLTGAWTWGQASVVFARASARDQSDIVAYDATQTSRARSSNWIAGVVADGTVIMCIPHTQATDRCGPAQMCVGGLVTPNEFRAECRSMFGQPIQITVVRNPSP